MAYGILIAILVLGLLAVLIAVIVQTERSPVADSTGAQESLTVSDGAIATESAEIRTESDLIAREVASGGHSIVVNEIVNDQIVVVEREPGAQFWKVPEITTDALFEIEPVPDPDEVPPNEPVPALEETAVVDATPTCDSPPPGVIPAGAEEFAGADLGRSPVSRELPSALQSLLRTRTPAEPVGAIDIPSVDEESKFEVKET